MLKSAPRDQLIAAVQIIAGGEQLLAPACRLIEDFVHRPHQAAHVRRTIGALSERELDVLKLVARGASTPRSRTSSSSRQP